MRIGGLRAGAASAGGAYKQTTFVTIVRRIVRIVFGNNMPHMAMFASIAKQGVAVARDMLSWLSGLDYRLSGSMISDSSSFHRGSRGLNEDRGSSVDGVRGTSLSSSITFATARAAKADVVMTYDTSVYVRSTGPAMGAPGGTGGNSSGSNRQRGTRSRSMSSRRRARRRRSSFLAGRTTSTQRVSRGKFPAGVITHMARDVRTDVKGRNVIKVMTRNGQTTGRNKRSSLAEDAVGASEVPFS